MNAENDEPWIEKPEKPQLDPKLSDALLRMFLGALVYRLGGEETFTESELQDIMLYVGGVQILTTLATETDEGRYTLRVRDVKTATEMGEKGLKI